MLRKLKYFIPFLTPETTETVDKRVIDSIMVTCIKKDACTEKLYSMPLDICIAPSPRDMAMPMTEQITANELTMHPSIPWECFPNIGRQEVIERGLPFLNEK